jgi:hypothetical protein
MALVKIRFKLDSGPFMGETMWAEHRGGDLYCLMNIPYRAIGYAEGDVVQCTKQDGWNEVVSMAHDSGNGTLRLLFTNVESPEAGQVLDELVSVGCTYERASSTFVGVTVPTTLEVPLSQLSNYLNDLPEAVLRGWEVGKWPGKAPTPNP